VRQVRHRARLFAVLVCSLCSQRQVKAGTGLCIVADEGCFAPTTVRVVLPESTDIISGAQFTVQYDASALVLLGVQPGQACDPASPFSVELFSTESQAEGTVFYAVGAGLSSPPPHGTRGPATLACLQFQAIKTAVTDMCIIDQGQPLATRLVDDQGHTVTIDNTGSCAGASPPSISCTTATVDVECVCRPNTADCAGLNTVCKAGVCNAATGHCERVAAYEGESCEDGSSCTQGDVCHSGRCEGSGCSNPSLCILSNHGCFEPGAGEIAYLNVRLGAGDPIIAGAQFSFDYDPAVMTFLDISPGNSCSPGSPFSVEAFESVDTVAGRVFYAVSVPFGSTGTSGPAVMACLMFQVITAPAPSVCLIENVNPRLTTLADNHGQRVEIYNGVDCPGDFLHPTLSCNGPCQSIPTVSQWGVVVLALVLLAGAKVLSQASRKPPSPI